MENSKILFKFTDETSMDVLRAAVAVNPFEKGGAEKLYETLKDLFPNTCTARTFKDRCVLEIKNWKRREAKNLASSGIEEEITERDSLAQELSLYRDEAERMLVEKKSAATSKAETEAKQEEFLRDQAMKALRTDEEKKKDGGRKDVVKKRRRTTNDLYIEVIQEKNKVKAEELKHKRDELEFAKTKDALDREERRRQEERNNEQHQLMMAAIIKLANK